MAGGEQQRAGEGVQSGSASEPRDLARLREPMRSLLRALTAVGPPPDDWQTVIQLAMDTLTIGQLAEAALNRTDAHGLSAEVRELLEDVRSRARARNGRMLDQLG